MSDSQYCYPGTNVLINLFNITDIATLQMVERDITAPIAIFLRNAPQQGNFDMKHLQKIHHTFFGDIYPFAGKIRTEAIAKTNLFCLPQFIRPMAAAIFEKLHSESCLRGLAKDKFIERIVFYFGEINALHPFREGNGRTQRIFLHRLSKVAGYKLSCKDIDRQRLLQAEIATMRGQYEPLREIFDQAVQPLRG